MVVHSAYMLINKAIPSTGGPYTVRFYDDNGNLIQTDTNVPQYGSAHCTLLDGTIVDGLYFKGWNPSPSVVTHNLDCYPVRGDYIIRHEETHDSWETICTDRGAHYPLGTYKSLVITIPQYSFDYDFKAWDGSTYVNKKTSTLNASSVNIALDMVKVAEGEDNSVSTWISTGVIYIDGDLLNTNKWTAAFGLLDTDSTNYTSDWGNSAIRKYLNTHFLENLPESLRNNIVQVNKAYIGFANAPHVTSVYPSQINKESLDKIWMLSKKELYTKVKDYPNITWWGGYEIEGIDYASVYVPTLSVYGTTQNSCLRTSANYNNRGNNYGIADSMGDPFNGSADLGSSNAYGKTMFGFCL